MIDSWTVIIGTLDGNMNQIYLAIPEVNLTIAC